MGTSTRDRDGILIMSNIRIPPCRNMDCKISTGINGAPTFGSGEEFENGYWENPCETCRSVWYSKHQVCEECKWSGEMVVEGKKIICIECNGAGFIDKEC